MRAVTRLASLSIEQLDRGIWADELLLAVRSVVPATVGAVRLLVDEGTWVTLATCGAHEDEPAASPAARTVSTRQRYLQAGGPLMLEPDDDDDAEPSTGAPSHPRVVGFPLLVEGELLGAVELRLPPIEVDDPARSDAFDEVQWLVDIGAMMLVNLEAYQREHDASELLQRLLDGEVDEPSTAG
ncbi:MAG: hypothetical protein ACOCT8_01925 [Actinomycetota bacterium]